MLEEEFNIISKHQVTNLSGTNLLDVGIWRGLQSAVENLNNQMRIDPDILAQTVHNTWGNFFIKTTQ